MGASVCVFVTWIFYSWQPLMQWRVRQVTWREFYLGCCIYCMSAVWWGLSPFSASCAANRLAATGVYTAGVAVRRCGQYETRLVADVSAPAAGIQATPAALRLTERNSSLNSDWVEVQPCAAPPYLASSRGCFSTWCWELWCSAP